MNARHFRKSKLVCANKAVNKGAAPRSTHRQRRGRPADVGSERTAPDESRDHRPPLPPLPPPLQPQRHFPQESNSRKRIYKLMSQLSTSSKGRKRTSTRFVVWYPGTRAGAYVRRVGRGERQREREREREFKCSKFCRVYLHVVLW